jgi:hypothetical protein
MDRITNCIFSSSFVLSSLVFGGGLQFNCACFFSPNVWQMGAAFGYNLTSHENSESSVRLPDMRRWPNAYHSVIRVFPFSWRTHSSQRRDAFLF